MNGYDFAHVIFSEKLTLNARDRLRLEREERATAGLQHRCQRDQERRSEQTEVSRVGQIDDACAEQLNTLRLGRPG